MVDIMALEPVFLRVILPPPIYFFPPLLSLRHLSVPFSVQTLKLRAAVSEIFAVLTTRASFVLPIPTT